MKKVKIEGKLNLKKETISQLNGKEMRAINGGDIEAWTKTNLLCGSSKGRTISCLCPLSVKKCNA